MAPGDIVRVAAAAKVNLYLHVLGRRADGYHELDSLVAFAGIGDVVAATPAATLTLAIDGPFASALAAAGDNLVLRAARLLAETAGIAPRAALSLTKNLPVASGIGGGSSDAAATLRALARLWRLSVDEATLAALGATLGADVPVCLAARTSWLGGVGARVEPAPKLPRLGIVLVNPLVALPTPSVFRARQGPFSRPGRFAETAADSASLVRLLEARRNDLTQAAVTLVPAIADILAVLAAGAEIMLARMSGSGATCFALCPDAEAARREASRVSTLHQEWWCVAGEIGDA